MIWEFGGEPLGHDSPVRSSRSRSTVPLGVATLLEDDEVEAISERARHVLRRPVFPVDTTGRRYPWPLV